MQIRTIALKELESLYELVQKIYPISYETFEDRIYEMRNYYTMIGAFYRGELRAFAGIEIKTTLKDGRIMLVLEAIASDEKSRKELKAYLEDYAKIALATKIHYAKAASTISSP